MEKSKFIPLFERIVVRRLADEPKMDGGLEIPQTQKEKPQRGVIVAAAHDLGGYIDETGEMISDHPLRVGMHVLIGKYAGIEQEIDGEDCVILHYKEILGYFNAEEHAQ